VANATVPRPRSQDSLPLTGEPQVSGGAARRLPLPPGLIVLWAGIVLAIALFLLFGSVRVAAGNWLGRRLSVAEIWSRFLGYLANQGASPVIVGAVMAVAGLTLLTGAALLWLAVGLRDQSPDAPPDNPVVG
jgi:hypothetical protein